MTGVRELKGLGFRVCAEINSQIFVSRRMPTKARKYRHIDIFLASATMSGVMHLPPKCEFVFMWALMLKNTKFFRDAIIQSRLFSKSTGFQRFLT